MPLGFQTLNRGIVAFGFFNVHTDLILLNNLFFFADRLCRAVRELARHDEIGDFRAKFDGYVIERPEDVGDLAGAIQGVRYEGFIGAIYENFPFPKTRRGFKQRPDGSTNRPTVERVIRSHAEKTEIPFLFTAKTSPVAIGDYHFDRRAFGELVSYIWDGGAPGWKNNKRPAYVIQMIREITGSKNHFLTTWVSIYL
ncbi:MAG: hypothetical protein GTN81_15600 [Proteobacteria bacterium]|nr:hypothetical protein [Pseudomonadota bacterium]